MGRNRPPTEMDLHLRSCQDCQELLRASNRLQRGLRYLPPVHLPVGLSSSIAALVLRDYRLRKQRRLRWLVGSLVAAAALFLVALSNRLVGLFDYQNTAPIHVEIQPQLQPRERERPHPFPAGLGIERRIPGCQHRLPNGGCHPGGGPPITCSVCPHPSLPPMGPTLERSPGRCAKQEKASPMDWHLSPTPRDGPSISFSVSCPP